jgi:hypothetical protein
MSRPNASSFLLGLIFLQLAGCTNINVYKDPIKDLRASVTRTKTAVAAVAGNANQVQAENAALAAAIESRRFGTNDFNKVIPAKYIKIRLKGLELIEQLSSRLLQVIDEGEGGEAAKTVEETGISAQALAAELNGTEAVRYSEPVAKLAAAIIRIYDNSRRKEILELGIREGLPSAKQIVGLLKKDFTPESPTDIQSVLRDELKQTVTERIALYDLLLQSEAKLSDKEKKTPGAISARLKAAEDIIAAQNAVDALDSELFLKTLDDLDDILDKLKDVVDSSRDPKTFMDFLSKINEFSKNSAALLNAVNRVRKAGEDASNEDD